MSAWATMLADGVGIEGLALGAGIPFLLLVLVVGFEAIVSARIMVVPFPRSLRVWLVANTISWLGGLVVLWLFGGQFIFYEWAFERVDFRSAIERTWLRCAAYFVETLLLELAVWRIAIRRADAANRGRILRGVLLANVLSYSLLYPLVVLGLSNNP